MLTGSLQSKVMVMSYLFGKNEYINHLMLKISGMSEDDVDIAIMNSLERSVCGYHGEER